MGVADESLGYSFESFRPHVPGKTTRQSKTLPDIRQFLTKEEVVDAFHNAVDESGEKKFKFIRHVDADQIPRDLWEVWIPENVKTTGKREFPIWTELGQDLGRGHLQGSKCHVSFDMNSSGIHTLSLRSRRIREQRCKRGNVPTPSARMNTFKSDHAFPAYKRYGYNDVDNFLDGYNWNCTWHRRKQWLKCVGTVWIYHHSACRQSRNPELAIQLLPIR